MERRIANQRQKSSTAIFLVIISVMFLMLVGLSYAYFSDTKEVSNTLNFGKLVISTQGQTTTTVELNPNEANGLTENGVYKIAKNDTVSIAGSIGLESGSVPAYIRMKVKMVDQNNNVISGIFKNNFMDQMAEMIDPTSNKQWFVIGDYLYLGNKIEEGNPFVFSTNNTNTSSATAEKNRIKMTEEMLTNEIQGKAVTIKFILQAIQSAAMKDASGKALTLATGYTQENATKIAGIPVWQEIFFDALEEYSLGTWTTPTHVENSMDARGTFNKGAQKEGKYTHIEFGTYPQTFYSTSNAGLTLTNEKYTLYNNAENNAGIKSDYQVYKDASGNKYVEITTVRSSNSSNVYSDEAKTKINSSHTAYFKLEPIIWEILGVTKADGTVTAGGYDGKSRAKLLLNTVKILTAGYINAGKGYANSAIKSYLEGGFYTNAFTGEEQNKISKNAILKTDTTGKGETDETTIGNEDTNNTVFLLGYKDINTYYNDNASRIKYPTDYAGANYAYRSSTANFGGHWWSRSAGSNTYGVWPNGGVGDFDVAYFYNYGIDCDGFGVVPALFLSI